LKNPYFGKHPGDKEVRYSVQVMYCK